jgi:hypothetical protein
MPFNHLPYNDAIGKKDSGIDIDQPRICQECGGIFKESDHETKNEFICYASEFCPECITEIDLEDDNEFWEQEDYEEYFCDDDEI